MNYLQIFASFHFSQNDNDDNNNGNNNNNDDGNDVVSYGEDCCDVVAVATNAGWLVATATVDDDASVSVDVGIFYSLLDFFGALKFLSIFKHHFLRAIRIKLNVNSNLFLIIYLLMILHTIKYLIFFSWFDLFFICRYSLIGSHLEIIAIFFTWRNFNLGTQNYSNCLYRYKFLFFCFNGSHKCIHTSQIMRDRLRKWNVFTFSHIYGLATDNQHPF